VHSWRSYNPQYSSLHFWPTLYIMSILRQQIGGETADRHFATGTRQSDDCQVADRSQARCTRRRSLHPREPAQPDIGPGARKFSIGLSFSQTCCSAVRTANIDPVLQHSAASAAVGTTRHRSRWTRLSTSRAPFPLHSR